MYTRSLYVVYTRSEFYVRMGCQQLRYMKSPELLPWRDYPSCWGFALAVTDCVLNVSYKEDRQNIGYTFRRRCPMLAQIGADAECRLLAAVIQHPNQTSLPTCNYQTPGFTPPSA